ncbi:hypothetical protein KAS42_01035 [bacterium]|nr:hypothetical protein [bacterium]
MTETKTIKDKRLSLRAPTSQGEAISKTGSEQDVQSKNEIASLHSQ